jgi:hypothetical protein
MTKPADDKLSHAKREIKALKLKLESCSRFASQHLGKIERLESIVESCSKRNESDCDLIDSFQEQVAVLEGSGWVNVDSGKRPERSSQLVLVWFKRFYGPGFMHLSRFLNQEWELDKGMTKTCGKVTHFIFLPEPPEQEPAE